LSDSLSIIEPKIKTVEETASRGVYSIAPLLEGFGATIGNALRRVLLSSLPGAAVTKIKIDGVSHEFSTLPGVKEDMLTIMLNIKKLNLQLFEKDSEVITLEVKGSKTVTAADFKCSSSVTIANKDLHLATLTTDKAKLKIECTVEKGRKFTIVDNPKPEIVGDVPVDALFSPIIRVGYTVRPTRVDKVTNYDELNIEIVTNGTIAPKTSLLEASSILLNYFSYLADGKKFDFKKEVTEEPIIEPVVDEKVTLEDLTLSTRTRNSLKRNSIGSIEQLLEYTDDELLSLKNFGQKALVEIKEQLAEKGIIDPASVPKISPEDDEDIVDISRILEQDVEE